MPLFTSANAREMARRGNVARWSRPVAEPVQRAMPASPASVAGPVADEYQQRRLARVRRQLDDNDAHVDAELAKRQPDARRLKELVDAQIRLSEQERLLAGRPMPGSLRPKTHDPRRRPAPTFERADSMTREPAELTVQ